MKEDTLEIAPAQRKQQTSALLIANPTSGSYQQHAQQIKGTVTYLQQQGWQVELRLTQKAGDASNIAREAVQNGIDVVVATGGDGTINEVIQELAGSETALGVLPSGTVNVWAREVGIPLDNASARSVLLNGQTRRVDLGKVNGHYFLLMAGIGVDGEVTYAVEKRPVKKLGVVGYLLAAAWYGLGYPEFRTKLKIDARSPIKTTALQIVIGNTQLYGGTIKCTWQAKCDDGHLDICIMHKQSMLGRIVVAIDFLLRRKERKQHVRYETCQTLKVYTRRPIAIQADGDPRGYTSGRKQPTIINIAPKALKVIVPLHLPGDLFTSEPDRNTADAKGTAFLE
ncbi:MAG TPA: diacylglycerol kinase family protein [Ktedonobacteraceae bacterium]|jgi:YegS/Rv2252/BmrU family lipid kinase|nr:diacylglycerol kinase family protein [Ktedonobacteraceae bacterium]